MQRITHMYAVSFYFMVYNFVKIHLTNKRMNKHIITTSEGHQIATAKPMKKAFRRTLLWDRVRTDYLAPGMSGVPPWGVGAL